LSLQHVYEVRPRKDKRGVDPNLFSQQAEPPAVAGAYDFSGVKTIVDVGGATGNMLAAILSRHGPSVVIAAPISATHDTDERTNLPKLLAPIFRVRARNFLKCVSKGRYDANQFADCVEAAFKEINGVVKEHVRRKTGEELDGAALMNKAFSPKNTLVVLDDLSTQSGRDAQLEYMQLYAGSMTGIRNPKAHANVTIDAARARHFLYLASLLAYRFDERL
jgi:uncharacterized protein (TIGR02391 family)